MPLRINPALAAVAEPPIAEAYGWIEGPQFPAAKPLIDVSQAVPGYPPPKELTDHLATRIGEPTMARYTDIEGLPELREALAADIGARYGGTVAAEQVVITAGCNQGFCLATPGTGERRRRDHPAAALLLQSQMWFDMQGIRAVHLPFRPERGGVPDPADAARAIGPEDHAPSCWSRPTTRRARSIRRRSSRAFYRLAHARGLALVIDETYRDFLPPTRRRTSSSATPVGRETLVHLYSFSKVFCLTGYRVGAIVAGRGSSPRSPRPWTPSPSARPASARRRRSTACAPSVSGAAPMPRMMRDRLARLLDAFRRNDIGYELVSAGAYFAYVRHPFDGRPAAAVARRLADQQNILCLPGSMFGGGQDSFLRFAFANVTAEAMPAIAERLAADARA